MANAKSLLAPEAIMYVVLALEEGKENRSVDDALYVRFERDAKAHQFIVFHSPGLPSSFE